MVDTATAKPALDFVFNLGLAAALRSLACLARRAPELPEEDDECDSLSDSLDDDDDSEPDDDDLEYFFRSLLRLDALLRPYGSNSSLCLCEAGGGGFAASCRVAAGEGARRRGAGGFMAVARADAMRRSRTITDGDNLCLDEEDARLLRRAVWDRELRELEEEYESSEEGGRRLRAAGSARIQGSAHSSPRAPRPSRPSRPSLPSRTSRPSRPSRGDRRSTSARCTITSRDDRTRLL